MPIFSIFVTILAITLVLVSFSFFYINKLRTRLQYIFNLQPNCLLTRYPIIFLSGKTSIFYYGRYWNCIPEWLEAHGYDVLDFEFSHNSFTQRTHELQSLLDLLKGESFHFAADVSSIDELEWLAQNQMSSVRSLTLFSSYAPPSIHPSIEFISIDDLNNHSKYLMPWRIISKFHSAFNKKPLCGSTLCLPGLQNDNSNIRRYLNWAISLAEKDLS